MPAFPSRGSAGAAPQTVWFGALPDRLNMLTPNSGGFAGGQDKLPPAATSTPPADYAKLWTLNNVTLGATTTAPDGTTANSSAIIEDSSNGEHYLSTTIVGPSNINGGSTGPLRLAGYFKNFGRRVVLEALIMAFPAGTNNNGFYVVFDLAGGQIGVTSTLITNGSGAVVTFTLLGCTISSQSNGWYLCTADFSIAYSSASNSALLVRTMLDNGTGTNARSTSYAGNGTSGIYGWRTNMMPVQSYAINNQTFFDDFTSLSTIDVNNTGAPGYNWYVNPAWTNVQGTSSTGIQSPAGPASFSVNNSVLTVLSDVSNPHEATLYSNTEQSPGTIIGNAWQPPALFEFMVAYRFDLGTVQWGLGQYGHTQEWLASQGTNATNPFIGTPTGMERDFSELQPNSPPPSMHFNSGFIQGPNGYFGAVPTFTSIGVVTSIEFSGGLSPYYPDQVWGAHSAVVGGVVYDAIGTVSINTPPPDGAHWSVVNYFSSHVLWPNAVIFDYTQQHLYSFLMLPYHGASTNAPGSPEQAGTTWIFIDGLMIRQVGSTAPAGVGDPYSLTVESQHQPIWLNCDGPGSGGVGVGVPSQYDFVRVMQ